jgi:tetraacyldisaccharide 4'-kinase
MRKFLLPLSLLYGAVAKTRNYMFDVGLLKSTSFNIPIICVGNLSTGGTGKTPHIEYLIRLLSDRYRVAVLSRGYGRKSSGFVLGDSDSNAKTLGDEPYQFYCKFPHITVAVDEDREHGIKQLLLQEKKPEVILLDDGFQHRWVQAGLNILLTTFDDLFAYDSLLPAGNLRESKKGAQRADVIIVTKCPLNMSVNDQESIRRELKKYGSVELYFTFTEYSDFIFSENDNMSLKRASLESKLVLAGIARPKDFCRHVSTYQDDIMLFSDHYNYSDSDIDEIQEKAKGRRIITTEKDYMRLKGSKLSAELYYLPITSEFFYTKDNFDSMIFSYLKKH